MIKNTIYTTVILSSCLLVGCGKEVTNRAPASDDVTDIRGGTTETFKLSASFLPNGLTQPKYKTFTKALEVRIPRTIDVKSGNAGNNTALLYFDATSVTDFGFYCKYIGGASTSSPLAEEDIQSGLKYNFDNCYMSLGDQRQINYPVDTWITQYEGSSLILELKGADSRFETDAEADLELKW
jgi:hypothetical protein